MALNENIKPSEDAEAPKPVDINSTQELHRTIQMLKGKPELVSKRPRNASKLSRFPYYRERFAIQLRIILDEMLGEYNQGIYEDRIWKYEDFEGALNKNSLYLRVQQSRQYLLDKLDPDKKYATFFEIVAYTIDKGVGIRLGYNQDIINPGLEFAPRKVQQKEAERIEWRHKIEEFLSEGNTDKELRIMKLALSIEEIEQIEASLISLDNIVYKIKSNMIFIAKTT